MNPAQSEESKGSHRNSGWPCWEPYVFTLGVLLAFVGFVIACGFLGDFLESIYLGWPLFLGLCTLAALLASFRRTAALASPVWSLLMSIWMGLAGISHAVKSDYSSALWYGLLGIVWCTIMFRAIVMRWAARQEQLLRMERAVQTMRRAADLQAEEIRASTPALGGTDEPASH